MTRSPTIKLAGGLRVQFTWTEARGLQCEWDPAQPRKMPRSLWSRYKIARNDFLARVPADRGTTVVVDADGVEAIPGTPRSSTDNRA